MDFSRYLRFLNLEGVVLVHGQDWGVNEFPDGQIQVWFDKTVKVDREFVCMSHPQIVELVWQTEKTLGPLNILVTYLYGARSDKKEGGNRLVPNIAHAIRELLATASSGRSLRIVAPHDSQQDAATLSFPIDISQYDGVVYPDASAKERQPWLHSSGLPEMVFGKARNQVTGEITGLTKPYEATGKRLLVADDICDGGSTFIKVADLLPDCSLDLCVDHGIFSGSALERLTQAGYHQIFTTDSFVQPNPEDTEKIRARCEVMSVWGWKEE